MKTEQNDIINAFEETDGSGGHYHTHMGLTKREYFAAMAMQGILSKGGGGGAINPVRAANDSVMFADELIKALNL